MVSRDDEQIFLSTGSHSDAQPHTDPLIAMPPAIQKFTEDDNAIFVNDRMMLVKKLTTKWS